MRIALLHPTYWPEVRRGSERLAHDLGATLARRGHDVKLITTHPGPAARSHEDGVEVYRGRRAPEIPGVTWYYDEGAAALPATLLELARTECDVVHALYPTDGWAASLRRRRGGPPFVLSIHGILDRTYLVRRRRRLQMLADGAAAAAAVSALSEAAALPLRRYAIADPVILPGGVIAADYAGDVQRPAEPTVLCPASLDDPRKGGALLADAFARLRTGCRRCGCDSPGGATRTSASRWRLSSATGSSASRSTAPRRWRPSTRAATATVLPSDNEAFGLVLVESLAAGTPVVAAALRRLSGDRHRRTSRAAVRAGRPRGPRPSARRGDRARRRPSLRRGLPRTRRRLGLGPRRRPLRGRLRGRRGLSAAGEHVTELGPGAADLLELEPGRGRRLSHPVELDRGER